MGFISSFATISNALLRSVPKVSPRYYSSKSASNGGASSLAIFDKDGTLICFHTMWTPWVTGMAHGLEVGTGLTHVGLGLDIFRLLGVSFTPCRSGVRVGPGLLAESTMPDIKGRLVQLLAVYGFEPRCASEIIDAVWREHDAQLHSEDVAVKPIIDDLPELFTLLKSKNFKIAVCTADNRRSTERTLKYLQLADLVDGVICGDDQDSKPKPNPYNVMRLCRELDVPPWRTYMIGDTLADVRMGKEAGLAASIGVLSGIGTRDHLAPYSDHIVDTVRDIVPLITGEPAVREQVSSEESQEEDEEEASPYRRSAVGRRQYATPFFAYMHSMKELM